MEKIEHIIAKQLRKRGLERAALAAFVCQKANEVFKGVAQAVLYKDGILTVATSREYVLQLQAESVKWREKINKKLPKSIVKRIRVRVSLSE